MGRDTNGRELWTRESIRQVENRLLQQIFRAETPEATGAAVSYAEYLRFRGLSSDNYPVFLKMLQSDNEWVLEALVGPTDPFELFASIPPNRYMVEKCFELLERWPRGAIHPITLASILGILGRTYSDPRDGNRLHPLSVSDVNNLGKHLNESEGQNFPQNRYLLDVLDDIGSLEGDGLEENVANVARQAVKIRGHFLDNSRSLEDCLPRSLLKVADDRRAATAPVRVFTD
jgi:hypothetical protein